MLQLRREASRASAAANVELMDFELRRPRVLRRRSPRVLPMDVVLRRRRSVLRGRRRVP